MTRRPARSIIKAAIGPAVALFVIAYFAGAAIVGPNGLTSLAGYKRQRAEHLAQLRILEGERERLRQHAELLDPRHVDPDYADELVRRQTGQIRPDEVILPGR